MLLRLTSIAGLMLIVLISAADAQQRDQRDLRDPRDRRDLQDRRDLRDRRDPQDRRDSQDRRDPRDRNVQRNIRDRGRDQGRDRLSSLVPLGERRIGTNVDIDTLRVGRDEAWYQRRLFRALHFFFEGSDVYFDSARIKYINGFEGPTQIIRRSIPPGGRYVLTFDAPVSYISEIQMKYVASEERPDGRAPAGPREPTTVRVYGEAVSVTQPGRDDWVKIDCDRVSILDTDQHVIKVGRREGRFMAIRLHARHAPILAWDLKVYYANGSSEEIDFRPFIEAGGYTRELDLIGNQRSIDRIEFNTRSDILPVDIVLGAHVRKPDVCVEGLQHLPSELLGTPSSSPAPPAAR